MNLSIRWKVTLATLAAVILGPWRWQVGSRFVPSKHGARPDRRHVGYPRWMAVMSLRPLFDQSGLDRLPPVLHAMVRELSQHARLRITIIRQDGTVLSDSAVPPEGLATVDNHLSRPEVTQALATGGGMDIRASHTTGERTYYVARLLADLATLQPGIPVIRLGLPLTSIEERVQHIQRDLAAAFGGAFLIAMALSLWVSRNSRNRYRKWRRRPASSPAELPAFASSSPRQTRSACSPARSMT